MITEHFTLKNHDYFIILHAGTYSGAEILNIRLIDFTIQRWKYCPRCLRYWIEIATM